MGQQGSSSSSTAQLRIRKIPTETSEHEGILKHSHTPFQNSKMIEVHGQQLFIQNTSICLSQLINCRRRLGEKFSTSEVVRIIQDLMYTLSYLQINNQSYPNLSSQFIYYVDSSLKVLPPSMVPQSTYNLAKKYLKHNKSLYLPLSPEMLIGLKYREPQITQQFLLIKSNVFALGMLMLQVCTLKPSRECYDAQTYELLNSVISSRINEVENIYSERIARIVANMLDYDVEERMGPKQFAIWINRQIKQYNKETQTKEVRKQLIIESKVENIQSKHCRQIKDKIKMEKQKMDIFANRKSKSIIKNRRKEQRIQEPFHNPYLKEIPPTQDAKYSKYTAQKSTRSPLKYNYLANQPQNKTNFNYSPYQEKKSSPRQYNVSPKYSEQRKMATPNRYRDEYQKMYNYGEPEHNRYQKQVYEPKEYTPRRQKENHSILRIKEQIAKTKKIISEFRKDEY